MMPNIRPPRSLPTTVFAMAFLLAHVAALAAPARIATATSTEVCAPRLAISRNATDLLVPYCANRPLDVRDEGVRRAIIVIHGDSRNAPDYFRYVARAAADAGSSDTLILAPQFLIAEELPATGLDNTGLYWSTDSWKQGDESATTPLARPWHTSSFGVVDALVEAVSARATYPNLQEVVVLGHSAGGQFVNRYAAATTVEQRLAVAGISYRYVVANPSTLLYLDGARWQAGTPGRFLPLTASQRSACSGFNRYKFGLEGLNPYAAAVGAGAIRAQFRARSVVYLLGDRDTSTSDPTMSHGCEAQWQGANRFERGTRYHDYLKWYYGDSAASSHRQVVVPGVGHDAQAMFRSPASRPALFGPLPVNPAFSDIAGHPFEADIAWLAAAGITGGCGSGRFCPNATVTRGQMASFIARALRLPAVSRDYFSDTKASLHRGDINRLAAAGITGGCGSGRFCPNATVTRGQMAAFLRRALV